MSYKVDSKLVCGHCGACACEVCRAEGLAGTCRCCGKWLNPVPKDQYKKEN